MQSRYRIKVFIFLGFLTITGIAISYQKIKIFPQTPPISYKNNSSESYSSIDTQPNRQMRNPNNLKLINQLTRKKHFGQAITLLEKAVKSDPNNADLLKRFGELEEDIGNSRQALDIFKQFHRRFFWQADPRVDLASQCINNDNLPLAAEIYKELIRENPNLLFARYQLARITLTQHHPKVAISILKSAIAQFPHALEAKHSLALVEQNLGRYTRALPLFQLIVKENPKNTTYLNDLGVCEYLSGYSDQAVRDFKRVLSIDPQATEAAISLISINRSFGKDKEARGICKRALPYIKPLHLQQSISQSKALKSLCNR